MSVRRYLELALQNYAFASPGAFYGSAGGRAPGSGLIYRDVIFPQFNNQTQDFDTLRGAAYVLTHECDIDPSNNRHFNDLVLVCPLILFQDFVDEYETQIGRATLESMVVALARNDVSRVFFLPPASQFVGAEELQRGALLYLNQISHTPASRLQGSAVCALSNYGLDRLDAKFKNHLFRPKAEPLPAIT
jgi:hypothetical protein